MALSDAEKLRQDVMAELKRRMDYLAALHKGGRQRSHAWMKAHAAYEELLAMQVFLHSIELPAARPTRYVPLHTRRKLKAL